MIDAHQHFWRLGRNDCAWPTPDLGAIYRDFEPGDLIDQAAAVGVSGSVLVQSQPSDRDTDYLLAVAAAEPFVRAVVGWTDLVAPSAAERIVDLATRPKLKGLRPMLQGLAEDDWILQPAIEPALRAMAERGLVFDALVYPRHLPHLLALAERYPDLSIVLDHAAKPPIAEGRLDPWRTGIAALAARPNVTCKLSGLLTEAAPEQGAATLKPYVDHLLAAFGPDRLMWGSDWPVLNLRADYAGWFKMTRALTEQAGLAALTSIFAATAASVYRLPADLNVRPIARSEIHHA